MPISFDNTNNTYSGIVIASETLPGFDFSVFGGLISNLGTISGALAAVSDENITLTNSVSALIEKPADSQFAVNLLGDGARSLTNDGTICGEVHFGGGWDTFFNTGLIEGRIDTGDGNDLFVNQQIADSFGGLTVGTVTGSLQTGAGDDTVLNTGSLRNVLLGDGNDFYSTKVGPGSYETLGRSGNVLGGNGDDKMFGGAFGDKFFGGEGNDTLNGHTGNDKLNGGDGNDEINGGDGNDRIQGGDGNDRIDAGNNNDRINAGSGDDTITGGNGNDLLTGGDGADVFVFSNRSDRDTITDFGADDRIALYQPLTDVATFSDLLANTEFTDGNAVIDLSGLFIDLGFAAITNGKSILTLENVGLGDLSADDFGLSDGILVVG